MNLLLKASSLVLIVEDRQRLHFVPQLQWTRGIAVGSERSVASYGVRQQAVSLDR